VPEVSVMQMMRSLLVLIGCKGSVDCKLSLIIMKMFYRETIGSIKIFLLLIY